jgi:Asp/Glu/hydantoin racemase
MDWKKEPAMVFVFGGTGLVQALMQLLIAFNVPISPAQQAAITTVAGLVLAFLTRQNVTPTSSLPPGVVGAMAEIKALRQADKP